MPRMGFAIEDQRSSSSFRFEEGRGLITDCQVARGTGDYNSAKCVLRVSIQRLGTDGKPTEDDVVEEDLPIGPLTKFHPGQAESTNDDDPQDLGEDGVGNCVFAVEGAHPDPKAKVSVFGKSLQEAGLRPALLNGFAPNLIGIDARFSREMKKYEGLEKDASNLVVKKEGILNLSEINKRDNTKASAPAAKSATKPNGAVKHTAPEPEPEATEETAGDGAEDPNEGKALELMVAMQGKAEQKLSRARINSKLMTLIAAKRIPPPMHKPIQTLFAKKDWLDEKAADLGWTVKGDEFVIPAA